MTSFDRITIDPEQMGGVPCLRHLRIPVATVVGLVAERKSDADILADYPDLEPEDICQALAYAAEAVRERQIPLLSAYRSAITVAAGAAARTRIRSGRRRRGCI